mmetsp:Transcript_1887/g.11368  ORF Transcript_1887/g.11368 Transcript_1887/m.11368 type:complete len:341 (-) Transcript_1887:1390-2412(-)
MEQLQAFQKQMPEFKQTMEDRLKQTKAYEFQFVVITRSTHPRNQYNYLVRSVLKLAVAVEQDPHVAMVVMNVGAEDTQSRRISELVPVKQVQEGRVENETMSHRKYLGKQLQDYATALGLCAESFAQYCCIPEDDVIVSSHLLFTLRILLARIRSKHGDMDRWGMLKMYYKEAWMGYATEVWYEPVVVGVGSGTATFLVCFLRTRRRDRVVVRTAFKALCLALPAGALCVLFSYLVGRPNLLQLRKAIPRLHAAVSPAPTAITAGILYPRGTARELREYMLDLLHNGSVLASDIAVGEYMTVRHLATYLAVPNLLDHIGFVSTNLMKVRSHKEHFGVWMP